MKIAIIEAAEELERQAAGLFDCGDGEAYKARLLSLAQRLRAKANQPIRLGPDRWSKEARFRPESSSPAIPDGWRLVPVEPTEEMCHELHGIYGEARSRWAATLGAAPAPPGVNESLTTGWQPIETAPESTRILVREGDDIYAAELYQSPYGDRVWSSYCGQPVVYSPEPDHWMPLPEPLDIKESLTDEKSSVIRAPQRGGG